MILAKGVYKTVLPGFNSRKDPKRIPGNTSVPVFSWMTLCDMSLKGGFSLETSAYCSKGE